MKVLYVAMDGAFSHLPRVDFWWIKPDKKAPTQLQRETLNRHAKGYFKNDPGRSRVVYAPFAALFSGGRDITAGLLRFRVVHGAGSTARAVMECVETGAEYFLALVWQEDWSSPLARSKHLQGQLVYQHSIDDRQFYARPFSIVDDKLSVPAGEQHEQRVDAPLPFDAFKIGRTALLAQK